MSEEIQERANPLLAKLRMPGQTYRLPSQGLFYDDGELSEDVKNGEVEVYPLTAMDEIILATPDKLLSGKAITEVFRNNIPQILKPEKLLARDVDFLMVCLRIVTFGAAMPVWWTHSCDKAEKHEYQVDLSQMVRQSRSVDPTKLAHEYHVTVGDIYQVVLQPMTQDKLIGLMQSTAFNKTGEITPKEAESMIVDTFMGVIKSVDDLRDEQFIREWLTSIPLSWKRSLEQSIQKVSQWGVDFETEHVCPDCGEPMTIAVSPNPFNFFT